MKLFRPSNNNEITTLCLYHRVDMDGKCSGAIVNYTNKHINRSNIWFIGCNYEKDFSIMEILQTFPNTKEIYIVDYSITPEDAIIVLNRNISIIWCDHHKTAIEAYEKHPDFEYIEPSTWDDPDIKEIKYKHNDNFTGVVSYKWSGAGLIYIVLQPLLVAANVDPIIISNIASIAHLVSIYDTWNHTNIEHWNMAYAFNNGTRLYNLNPTENKWDEIFKDINIVSRIISEGEIVIKITDIQNKITADAYCGTLNWEGYNFCTINKLGNSNMVNSAFNPSTHDAVLCFMYSPKEGVFKVSMYSNDKLSEEQKEHLDLSQIAVKYNGGGHKHACGFSCVELPFKLQDIKPILK